MESLTEYGRINVPLTTVMAGEYISVSAKHAVRETVDDLLGFLMTTLLLFAFITHAAQLKISNAIQFL